MLDAMAERSSWQWVFVVAAPVVIIGGGIAWGLWTPRTPKGPTEYTAAPDPVDASPSRTLHPLITIPDDAGNIIYFPLQVTDPKVGTGPAANKGDKVSVHYVGTLDDGTEFDSSRKHGKPFDFELGAGRVIKGWDEGIVGMKVGGKRHLRIPPSLGYGPRGFPPVIPPNSVLVFDVELLDVTPKVP